MSKTNGGSNALHFINDAGVNYKTILEKLIAAGIKSVKDEEGRTFLHWCVRFLESKEVDEILNITQRLKFDVINECDYEERTPLHWAAYNGKRDTMEILLDRGANINVQDSAKRTPLIYCAHFGHYDCVKLLLERGADKNIKDSQGFDAKHHATHHKYQSIVELLGGKRSMSTQTTPQKIVQAMPVDANDFKDIFPPQYKKLKS